MKMGKVQINLSYIVDLDDEEMVKKAKEAINEYVSPKAKYDAYLRKEIIEQEGDFSSSDIPAILYDGDDCDGSPWEER